jgi:hypothetical protein
MADKYVIVSGQNLTALQTQINNMLAQGYQPLSGTFLQTNSMFYQGMAYLAGVPVPFGNVTGISDLFRQMSTITDKELLRQAVGSLFLGYNADNAKPGDWKPDPDDIDNISDLVRMLLKTSTKPGMREVIGAGTSSLIIGAGGDEAKPGDWKPDVSDISGASEVIQALLESNNEQGARAAIGAGTSNLKVGTGATDAKAGDWLPKNTDIQGLSVTLIALLAATDAATARSVIGAGTSNLTVGSDSTQAKAGNWRPAVSDISDLGSTAIAAFLKSNGAELTAAQQLAIRAIIGAGTSSLAIGTTATTAKAGNYAPSAQDISDASDIGKALMKAATVAAALQAISGNTPQTGSFLRADGVWQVPAGTTYGAATQAAAGLMSATDKQRLDNIAVPIARAIGAGERPVGTAFTIDSARWADVTYSFSATLTATIAANQNVQIDALVDGAVVARLAIGITLSLAVTVGMTLPFTHSMTFRVPPGKSVQFAKTGTAAVAVTVAAGQETLL